MDVMRVIARKLAMDPLQLERETKKLGDESFRKERTMNDVMVQAVLWVGAAATLLLYLKRRRKRKMVP